MRKKESNPNATVLLLVKQSAVAGSVATDIDMVASRTCSPRLSIFAYWAHPTGQERTESKLPFWRKRERSLASSADLVKDAQTWRLQR